MVDLDTIQLVQTGIQRKLSRSSTRAGRLIDEDGIDIISSLKLKFH